MEYRFLSIFTLLSVALVATHAVLLPEAYWKSVLSTTPMPKAITHILYPDWVTEKDSSFWADQKKTASGPQVTYHYDAAETELKTASDPQVTYHYDAAETQLKTASDPQVTYHYDAAETEFKTASDPQVTYHYDAADTELKTASDPQVTYHYDAADTELKTASDPQVTYHYAEAETQLKNPNAIQVTYHYADAETRSHEHNHDHNVALFFLENDLCPGTKLDLHFTKTSNQATLLPRQVADTLPFSSNNLNVIFEKFSVKPGSREAKIMKNTIRACEAAPLKGEEKYCATSLESMVDFTTSILGKNVDVMSTEIMDKEKGLQTYTVAPGVKKLADDKVVVCHKLNYPYAVFYCHNIDNTRSYFVPLEGGNGVRVKALAVCHVDTSEWNPKHLAFHVLNVKPGTVPVCHFLTEDVLVWTPKQIAST